MPVVLWILIGVYAICMPYILLLFIRTRKEIFENTKENKKAIWFNIFVVFINLILAPYWVVYSLSYPIRRKWKCKGENYETK